MTGSSLVFLHIVLLIDSMSSLVQYVIGLDITTQTVKINHVVVIAVQKSTHQVTVLSTKPKIRSITNALTAQIGIDVQPTSNSKRK